MRVHPWRRLRCGAQCLLMVQPISVPKSSNLGYGFVALLRQNNGQRRCFCPSFQGSDAKDENQLSHTGREPQHSTHENEDEFILLKGRS